MTILILFTLSSHSVRHPDVCQDLVQNRHVLLCPEDTLWQEMLTFVSMTSPFSA
jgi:hypothetical protein